MVGGQTFEQRIAANYRTLRDFQLLTDIRKFLEKHPKPQPEFDARSIENLTRVARHGLSKAVERQCPDMIDEATLEACITYCEAGADYIKQRDPRGIQRVTEDMHGFLYARAADFAEKLAEVVPEKHDFYLFLAYQFLDDSLKIAQKFKHNGSIGHRFSRKASIEQKIADLPDQDKKDWHIRAANDKVSAAECKKEKDPMYAGQEYTFASDYMYNAAQVSDNEGEQVELARKALSYGIHGASLCKQRDGKHWSITCLNNGQIAEFIYKRTHQRADAITAIDQFDSALKYLNAKPAGVEKLRMVAHNLIRRVRALSGIKES